MNRIRTPQELYVRLHNDLMEEHSRQDNRGDKRFEHGKSTCSVDGVCYGLEKAIRILEKAKEDLVDEADID